jgi:hypothetical protein
VTDSGLSSTDTPIPATQPRVLEVAPAEDRHLVVVMTRAVRAGDAVPASSILITRFWHPRDRRWSENSFDSIDHALRLFLDESGWTLIQRQDLADPQAHELIFEARRRDFTGPTTEGLLEAVGLTPADVTRLLDPPPTASAGRGD